VRGHHRISVIRLADIRRTALAHENRVPWRHDIRRRGQGQRVHGLALAHGYDIGFWWIAGIFAGGAVLAGVLFRRGPLDQKRIPSHADDRAPMAQAGADPALPA
jgi:hypothetical protein